MTNSDLLTLIKNNNSYKTLAEAGSDNALADMITATLSAPVPITVLSLAAAAPITLSTIASGSNPLSEMEVIASRVRNNDYDGVGLWATTLHMLGKMSDAEHTAVQSLVTAATVNNIVDHTQVSNVLNSLRPVVDGGIRSGPINWS